MSAKLHPGASPNCQPNGSKIGDRPGIGEWGRKSRTGDFMPEFNPAGGPRRPDPNEKLVKVFDSELESEALVVKGLLDSAEIDSDLMSASLVQDAFPGLGGMIILVREEDAEAARRPIEEYRQSAADDDEAAEIEISEERPPKA
jgi:hypothetical protein